MTLEKITGERRTAGSVQIIALYVTILINVVAIVWGAATLSAEVTSLRETVKPLVGDVTELKIANAIRQDRESRGKEKQ